MKAISTRIIINSIRSRKDGSLGFSAETPELSVPEKIDFMNLQGNEIKALLEPLEGSTGLTEVKTEIGQKSQSQRLRGIIYVYLKSKGKESEADKVYFNEMERLIDKYKDLME